MKNKNSTENGECVTIGNTPSKSEKMDLIDIIEKRVSGIYKIINKVNDKYYVGSTKNIPSRWGEHKWDLRRNIHHNDYLQHSWNKYGEHNFYFIVVEYCLPEQKLIIEQKYLDIAKVERDKSYNLSFIAEGGDLNETSRKKISNSLKNYYINHPEMKEHLSKIHTGIKQTAEHIKNAADAKRGKNHWLYGKHLPLETRKKLSGTNHPLYNYTVYTFHNTITNETFIGTQNSFYTKYNLLPQNIWSLIRGIRKSCKKWICLNPKSHI